MNDTSAHFRMRDWKYVPKRQRRACVTLIVCILFFLASASATVLLLILDARSANPVLPQVMAELTGKAEPEVQQPEFPGGALPESADAGQAYLDETIFVGDSNTVRMFAYGLVPLENYMALEGMGIESISQAPCVYFSGETKVYTFPQAIAQVKPRRVVMTFGTNNASGQFTRESFIDAYRDAIAAIQDAYPYCDVIINAIPPIGKVRSYPDITMETLDDFNKALEELAQELGLPFLNSSEALKGGDGYAKPDYVIGDGLHLSQAALEELLFYTRTHAYEAEDRRPVAVKAPERKAPPAWQGVVAASGGAQAS